MATADIVQPRVQHIQVTFTTMIDVPSAGLVQAIASLPRTRVAGGIFQSVELVTCEASLACRPLASGHAHLAFVPDAGRGYIPNMTSHATAAICNASLYSAVAYFAPNDPTRLAAALTSGHAFGHELKALCLGNNSPAIAVRFADLNEDVGGVVGQLRLTVTVRVSGSSPDYVIT